MKEKKERASKKDKKKDAEGSEDGKDAKGKGKRPPRPRNPWILFRGDALKMYKPAEGETGQQQAQVSKEIAKMWRNASPQIRAHYEDLAEIEKAEHKAKYPDYKYQPKSKEQKLKEKEEKAEERKRLSEEKKKAKQQRQPSSTTTVQAPEIKAAMEQLVCTLEFDNNDDVPTSPPLSLATPLFDSPSPSVPSAAPRSRAGTPSSSVSRERDISPRMAPYPQRRQDIRKTSNLDYDTSLVPTALSWMLSQTSDLPPADAEPYVLGQGVTSSAASPESATPFSDYSAATPDAFSSSGYAVNASSYTTSIPMSTASSSASISRVATAFDEEDDEDGNEAIALARARLFGQYDPAMSVDYTNMGSQSYMDSSQTFSTTFEMNLPAQNDTFWDGISDANTGSSPDGEGDATGVLSELLLGTTDGNGLLSVPGPTQSAAQSPVSDIDFGAELGVAPTPMETIERLCAQQDPQVSEVVNALLNSYHPARPSASLFDTGINFNHDFSQSQGSFPQVHADFSQVHGGYSYSQGQGDFSHIQGDFSHTPGDLPQEFDNTYSEYLNLDGDSEVGVSTSQDVPAVSQLDNLQYPPYYQTPVNASSIDQFNSYMPSYTATPADMHIPTPAMNYPTAGPSTSSTPSSTSSSGPSSEESPASSSSSGYRPPRGVRNPATRRVAGSWRPPASVIPDSPPPVMGPAPYQYQAMAWDANPQ